MSAERDVVDLWAEGQASFSALGHTLDVLDGTSRVPACPEWTIRHVFAHQAGVAADLLAGRLEGVATDEWTQRQVDERRERSLAEILAEWDADAPELIARLKPVAEHVDRRLAIDLWTHEQDVRGALTRPGNRTGPLADWAIARLRSAIGHRFTDAGLAPVTIDFGDDLPPAEGGRLLVSSFEFARAAVGRRSPSQIRSWLWEVGDLTPYAALVPLFGPREDALVEPGEDDL